MAELGAASVSDRRAVRWHAHSRRTRRCPLVDVAGSTTAISTTHAGLPAASKSSSPNDARHATVACAAAASEKAVP
ncbi:hypothetical protein ACFYT3_11985 [Nocardia amikacinitolerans]|uniref:hypothetical protein n=1 Tax=Nocardia amikacinitolerans TaxID=756689 RepID=UPI0020A46C3C|nr:hypothetical protein [Nocardia amikacinitolerans]